MEGLGKAKSTRTERLQDNVDTGHEGQESGLLNTTIARVTAHLEKMGIQIDTFWRRDDVRNLTKGFALASLLTASTTAYANENSADNARDLWMGNDSAETTPSWQKPPVLQKIDQVMGDKVDVVLNTIGSQATPENIAGTAAGMVSGPLGMVASEFVGTLREKENADRDRKFIEDLKTVLKHGGGEVTHANLDTGAIYLLRQATSEEVAQYQSIVDETEEESNLNTSHTNASHQNDLESELERKEAFVDTVENIGAQTVVGLGVSAVLSGGVKNAAIDLVSSEAVGQTKNKVPKPWEMSPESQIELLHWTSGNPCEHDGIFYVLDRKAKLPFENNYDDVMEGIN